MQNQGETSQAPSRTGIKKKVFNDCAHGHITLPPICVAIINSPTFHRLRNVKQMGFCYHVYPAASHNRFEHCLGVSYLAGKMVDILNDDRREWITSKERLCLQIAGLCHDLGHGPFSHSWETFVHKATNSNDFKHEEMSFQLFELICRTDKNVREELIRLGIHDDDILFIKDLIMGVEADSPTPSRQTTENVQGGRWFLYEIINNVKTGIDVDKWDYLLRDGKQLNIKMSFDHERLMHSIRICETTDNEYHICYRDKVKNDILQMYTMRAELHRRAAQHRVVKCLDAMWIDALLEADRAGFTFHGELLRDVCKNVEVYKKLNDNLFDEILNSTDSKFEESRKLLERIISRNLYTCFKKHTLGLTTPNISEIERYVEKLKKDKRDIIDLYVNHTTLKLPNLSTTVFLYEKNSFQGSLQEEEEWRNEHTFPQQSFEVHRQDVFFYQKDPNRTNWPRLKREVQIIMETREVQSTESMTRRNTYVQRENALNA